LKIENLFAQTGSTGRKSIPAVFGNPGNDGNLPTVGGYLLQGYLGLSRFGLSC
jgi:hypothetical protein